MPRQPKKKAIRKRLTGPRTEMRILSEQDVEQLRAYFSKKGPLWDQWEYKLRAGTIIICTPVTPFNPRRRRPDPSWRYMAKHLRIVPVRPGPFQLEYRRHTERWCPLDCVGSLEIIMRYIETHEICAPLGQERI